MTTMGSMSTSTAAGDAATPSTPREYLCEVPPGTTGSSRCPSDASMTSIDAVGTYPSQDRAQAAVARHHGRPVDSVLVTAGAAEGFTLVARARPWRRPVVVHPQFTEPHAALEQAGHRVTPVVLTPPFALDPALVPDDADLVIIGNAISRGISA